MNKNLRKKIIITRIKSTNLFKILYHRLSENVKKHKFMTDVF